MDNHCLYKIHNWKKVQKVWRECSYQSLKLNQLFGWRLEDVFEDFYIYLKTFTVSDGLQEKYGDTDINFFSVFGAAHMTTG